MLQNKKTCLPSWLAKILLNIAKRNLGFVNYTLKGTSPLLRSQI